MLAQEIIRIKRDGGALANSEIADFVRGLVDGSWSEAQAASMAMAIFLQGMSTSETIALTDAMTRSGEVLEWGSVHLGGPILDKHSTGGVGDKVSLMLAPIVAACGGFVPMISGRGLGHTGGTLDKLDSIPGYTTASSLARVQEALRYAGCAIVGQTADIAPADKRLYAVRDVTATVESLPLITASILSKKLAAGLQGLVMDVKTGNGAFAATRPEADALAHSLVSVAQGAGLPTRAWITDMDQMLGRNCGNAVEVREAIAFLKGEMREPRLLEITRQLSAELLLLGKRAAQRETALDMVDQVLSNGAAVEKFARMVSILGGPSDLVERPDHYLPAAPEERTVLAERGGWVVAMDTRQIGLLLIELGAGRRQASDRIDARVGLSGVVSIGQRVERGDLLARVHALTPADAEMASKRLASLLVIGDSMVPSTPVMVARAGD